MKLSDLKIDDSFVVDEVETTGEIRQRIIEMGFTKGATGWIVRKAPLGDPIQVHVLDYDVSLRKSEALSIKVLKTDLPKGFVNSDSAISNTGDDEAEVPITGNSEKVIDKNKQIVVAIAGNPNAGKTTIFNALTGLNYKVANYPGVTVEKKETLIEHNGTKFRIIDLPGIYSLSAYSEDEVIACNYLLQEKPDYIINVLDSTNLERNLYLTLQLTELGIPLVSALNMYEKAEKQGVKINENKLSKLLKFPLIKVAGDDHKSVLKLLDEVTKIDKGERAYSKEDATIRYNDNIETAIKLIVSNMNDGEASYRRWLAIKALEKDERAFLYVRRLFTNSTEIIDDINKAIKNLETLLDQKTDALIADARYGYIKGGLKQHVFKDKIEAFNFTDAADVVFLNKYLGLPIFLVVLWLIFQATFTLGVYPQDFLDMGISAIANIVSGLLPDGLLKSAIVDGVIGGVGSVLSFLPLVLILFLGISFLEDCGYMSRAAFLMDKIMHKFGLHGQSFIPLFVGFGCTIPAIMAARTLRSKKDRIVTILISTLMSCGARLPVYVLFIGAFFAPEVGGTVMFSLYLIGIFLALVLSLVFRKAFFKSETTPFVMELPPYRIPRVRTIVRGLLDRTFMYVKRAGTYVLLASILIWVLITFPEYTPTKDEEINFMGNARQVLLDSGGDVTNIDDIKSEYDILIAKENLRQSFAGHIGLFIEPVIKPLGFDWRMGIALVAGGAAKEVIVSTVAQIIGIEDGDEVRLTESLQNDKAFTPIVAYSFLLFVLIYVPCFAAVGVIGSEIGNKWMLFVVAYTVVLAWIVSFVFFQIASMLFG